MVDIAAIAALIEPDAQALGFDLVRVRWFAGEEPTLQVMAERAATGQLGIADCAELSRSISERFDAMEEAGQDPIPVAYRLEVSSPGIDRPLTRAKDWANWAGHEAKVSLDDAVADGRKHLHGQIHGIDGSDVRFRDRKSGDVSFPLSAVADAKLVLTNALLAAVAPLSSEGADEIEEED